MDRLNPETDNTPLGKAVAWNGTTFKIPDAWEIDSLDFTHVMVSENGSPRAEIKWTDSPPAIPFEKHFRNFMVRSQKLLKIIIHEQSTPPFFLHSNPSFDFFFFSWENTSSKGTGALIYCRHCRRLTLIRFFDNDPFLPASPAHGVLASFTDHPVTGRISWQLFGMAFSTPENFRLSDYSLKPGFFSFTFLSQNIQLTVLSWGPALFLLAEKTLNEFARERLPELTGLALTGACDRGNYLEWSFRRGLFKNAGRLPFLSSYSRFVLFRIGHDKQNNRIYGVKIDSPRAFEIDLMKGSILGDG
jgi:hypothetical protein